MIGIFEYFLKKEIPILMYHRLINNENGIGKNTIYLNVEKFEKQLKYLKDNNYITITFKDLYILSKEDRKKRKYITRRCNNKPEDILNIVKIILIIVKKV